MVWRLCALLGAVAAAKAAKDTLFAGSAVELLVGDDIESIVSRGRRFAQGEGERDAWMVNFYAPWCGHCRHYAPTWKTFAALVLANRPATSVVAATLRVGALSCAAYGEACQKQGVRSYPTLKAFFGETGDTGEEFTEREPREMAKLVSKRAPLLASAVRDTHSTPERAPERAQEPSVSDHLRRAAPTRRADAAASARYALESAVFFGEPSLAAARAGSLREILAALALALPELELPAALLGCLAQRTMRDSGPLAHSEWANWLAGTNCSAPEPVAATRTSFADEVRERVRQKRFQRALVRADAWSNACDADGAGANGPAYTCGLWALFHALAAAAGEGKLPAQTAADAMRTFVDGFFACAPCREHFLTMYDGCWFGRCTPEPPTLSLWLWKAHNAVNARVLGAAAEGEKAAEVMDAAAAHAWPSAALCPRCVDPQQPRAWNEREVERYLQSAYGEDKLDNNSLSAERNRSRLGPLRPLRSSRVDDAPAADADVWLSTTLAAALFALALAVFLLAFSALRALLLPSSRRANAQRTTQGGRALQKNRKRVSFDVSPRYRV